MKASKRNRPAQKQNVILNYFSQHRAAASNGRQQLGRQWFLNSMIITVIGIAMALPTLLFISFNAVQQYDGTWHDSAQAAIYITPQTEPEAIQKLIQKLQHHPHIKQVTYISPQQGLAEFQIQANLGNTLDALDENPLPGVVLITPNLDHAPLQAPFKQLAAELRHNAIVDTVDLDIAWVNKLLSIMHLGSHTIIFVASLLGISMLLIVCNMVYLVLQRYSHDIDVYLIVGASKRFIRRPYLYMGLYYGALASCINWGVVALCCWWLQPALIQLTQSYGGTWSLSPPPPALVGITIAIGLTLGLFGARLAAWQYLKQHHR